jgi:hypothetical protein
VSGIAADDLGDVDATFLETGDGALGRVQSVAVARHRVC